MIIDSHCHVWDEKLMSDELKEVIYGIAEHLGYSDPSLELRGLRIGWLGRWMKRE